MTTSHFLSTIFQRQDFSESELETIVSQFKPVTFAKNDYLLREGDVENQYWFVENGFLRSYVLDPDGNDITTNFFSREDSAIDWPSFFLRTPTRENIQALTDCVCWQLDYEAFQSLFHGMPTFREQGRKRLVSAYFALKNRSVAMIADQAKERYVRLLAEKPHIIQNASLKHIATYLGITDTSLSRIRKEISHK